MHSVSSRAPHSALTCTGLQRTQDALGASTVTMQKLPRTVKVEILERSGSQKPLRAAGNVLKKKLRRRGNKHNQLTQRHFRTYS